MFGIDAIYTRQSVDRVDSISVKSQVEFCQKEVINGPPKIYTDKGYSGKNIDRPAFQQMMEDIKQGTIKRVIVYRLDRISRSVLDFASVIDLFQRYHVDFVSTMEKFDTGTPIGKAMLMIVMIFAQLERETIQQRVLDAYISRSKRGFYMGGKVPYGFTLRETVIDGVKTKMYAPIPEEIAVVRQAYEIYSAPQASFGDVLRFFNEKGIQTRRGTSFNRSRIRDIVTNPVYVQADYRIYEFYKAQGTNIENAPEDFIGVNGAYLYSGSEKKRKTVCLEGHMLVLAPHEGVIDSRTWIKCRSKCLNNQKVAKPLKAKATWLAGKIKCASCGYALTAKTYHCKTKEDNRYYLCTHKYSSGVCTFGSVDADFVDAVVFEEMVKKLEEFGKISRTKQQTCNLQAVKLKTRIEEIDSEINGLLDKFIHANNTMMEYINSRVATLDSEKRQLYGELVQLDGGANNSLDEISNYLEHWDHLEIGDKMAVVDTLIESVTASKEKIVITWKI